MNYAERELLVARICSGVLRSDGFVFHPVSRDDRYIAQQIYAETLRDAELMGVYTDDELLATLIDPYSGENSIGRRFTFWTLEEERRIEEVRKEIEDCKVRMFSATFQSEERARQRTILKAREREADHLYAKRHSLDYLSAPGIAAAARLTYLMGCALRLGEGWYDGCAVDLDRAISVFQRSQLGEAQFRELARSEPWRSTWAAGREGSVFGGAAADLTDEQKSLINWSRLYDNIHESPEAPSDEVLEDDDLLDGWLIIQRRKRESEQLKTQGEGKISSRVSQSDEVFLVADTKEDAKRIHAMNDVGANIVRLQRANKIKKEGVVRDIDMPDVRMKMMSTLASKKG